MLTPLLSPEELALLQKTIDSCQKIVICAHRGPDGDAVGSALAWADYLKSLGKQVNIVMPSPFPDFLKWLPNSQTIRNYSKNEAEATKLIEDADLIFCLDLNSLPRLQDMERVVKEATAREETALIAIDHHEDPQFDHATQVISFPRKCATCEIVFQLIFQLGGYETMSKQCAICLYTGMMTDTGGFTYNSNEPDIFEIISLLLKKGIDKDQIYRRVFYSYSVDRIRLMGYLLHEKVKFFANNHAAVFTLTRKEMKKFNFIRGDAEGLVNLPLQVKGMKLSISLREDTERDEIRVSLRSVGNFSCREMAEKYFNGGGHFNAAGGKLPFPIEEAMETAKRAIAAYEKELYLSKD